MQATMAGNADAMKAFIEHSVGGMGLSDAVWRDVKQLKQEMEAAITMSVGAGESASTMSRKVRQYLNEPDKLFRRVRNEKGELVPSKAMKQYHPGRGVYRSSAKNAMRVARTETNMAYRASDHERMQKMDFVRGIEVHISNRHKGEGMNDICDCLAGKYPKEFKFVGWHPQCLCYVTTVLASRKEVVEMLKARRNGEPYEWKTDNIDDVPEGMKTWMEQNEKRIKAANKNGKLPYFIKDNFIDGKVYRPRFKAPTKAEELEKQKEEIKKNPIKAVETKPAAPTSAIDKYDANIEKALGIKKGTPMTFEEANEMKANPNYMKEIQYCVNCQSTVVANELRRRGWDVEAFGKVKDSASYALSMHTEMAWIDENGKIPIGKGVIKGLKADINGYKRDIEEYTKEIGRYHVKVAFKGSQDGHIITAERLNDGTIRYYDPQRGEITQGFPYKFGKLNMNYGVRILRVDNLTPNPNIVTRVVKPVGSTKKSEAMTAAEKKLFDKITKGDISVSGKKEPTLTEKYFNAKSSKERVELLKNEIENHQPLVYNGKKYKDMFIYKGAVIEKSQEFNGNLHLATKLNNKGYTVYMCGNPSSGKSGDFIVQKGDYITYIEAKKSTGKNSLNHNFADGSSQSDKVYVDIQGTKNAKYVASQIQTAFEKNTLSEVWITSGNKMFIIKDYMIDKGFAKWFVKQWHK